MQFPLLFVYPHADSWLTRQQELGLAPNTLSAYARALLDYFAFCHARQLDAVTVTVEHIATYLHDLATRPVTRAGMPVRYGLANATKHQRLVALRLYYDYLVEQGVRETTPLTRGLYAVGRHAGVGKRGLLPHYHALPWIPTDAQWGAVLTAARQESIRTRFMLALAYDAGLRRGELCALRTEDVDPTHRLLTLRAETTKSRRARVVPYSEPTSLLYAAYLQRRRELSRARGALFLSESRRNQAQPLTQWTWSKVVHALAQRAGVPHFTTHTTRHLCLTDLARAGWELHEIATFAGHRSLETTLAYIHLSGRDLAAKLAQGMDSLHAWRVRTMQDLLL
ncbi:tyrosine-type recombinase/integrase [Hymenobacter sp. 5414T-23]|uniref:tyrosine-type recombinase/integrase n=1 Tax=Hymenobacter sp. 5414T-23 TaxID=2932252 RepID=UPI001FD382EA|nr:site-specific integrase [Hymenobacter sp. 5414T-23]UOQ83306.1 tyrosine-type recombinase/integrase [Hymenobacter sp. 5414T-23]